MSPTEVTFPTDVLGVVDCSTATKLYESLHDEIRSMAQLKSDFDIQQFTLNSQGPFPCHAYHFLMRQYSLAVLELRRLNNDRRKMQLKIADVKANMLSTNVKDAIFPETELEDAMIQIDQLELSIWNKKAMCKQFELCRAKLVEQHGGKPFTNMEYQKEEPAYWQWYFTSMFEDQWRQRQTGISEGLWKNLRLAGSQPLLNNEFQIEVLPIDTLKQMQRQIPVIPAVNLDARTEH